VKLAFSKLEPVIYLHDAILLITVSHLRRLQMRALLVSSAVMFFGVVNAVQAAPFALFKPDTSGLTLVADGCGGGWHRNVNGVCVVNGAGRAYYGGGGPGWHGGWHNDSHWSGHSSWHTHYNDHHGGWHHNGGHGGHNGGGHHGGGHHGGGHHGGSHHGGHRR
jgi:hypothetical protein